MSKPARGTKRVCASCGARFYDLGRSPITCPVCQAVYQITPPPSSRRNERAAAPVEQPKPAETPAETPPATEGAEVISLDEAEQAEEADVKDEDIAADIGGDDEDIPESDDEDDTFLEDDEEEDADVSGIVKSDRNEDG